MMDWLARAFGMTERHSMRDAEGSVVPHGDRRYGVADPEGHHWYFATRTATNTAE